MSEQLSVTLIMFTVYEPATNAGKPGPYLYANAIQTRMRHAKMREILMWTCSQSAANSIRFYGECSVNSPMLSVWSRRFKEKYVRNHTDVDVCFASLKKKNESGTLLRLLSRRMLKKPLFAHMEHSFRFVSVPHASLAFVCKCGPG